MQDLYEADYDMSAAKFDDEFELPEAPESWSLDDFDDVVGGYEEFSY